ncbi:hypothetical protein OG783_06235 [Streptomyces jietaisiensis]|uniref:hypothetical protein n=1 Tax=Streptomyces griseoaurantiacus TaxID=68213 RepID=UPI0032534EA4
MIDPSSINLHQFLTVWHGKSNQRAVIEAEVSSELPPPLLAWHTLAKQWSKPLVRNKKLLTPEEFTTKGGKIVFMTEPGDAIWGFDPESPEVVYEGRIHGDWVRLAEGFTEFLIHNAMNEAAYNAPYTKSCESVQNEHIARIVEPMTEIAFGGWHWPRPGHRIFMSESLIADIGPAMEDEEPWGDKPGFSEVQVGAITPSALHYLSNIPGTDWY